MTEQTRTRQLTVAEILDFESTKGGSRGAAGDERIARALGMRPTAYRIQLAAMLTTPDLLRLALSRDAFLTNLLIDVHATAVAAREKLAGRGSR